MRTKAKKATHKAFSLSDFDDMRFAIAKHQKLSRLLEETASVSAAKISLPFRSGGSVDVEAPITAIRKIVRDEIAACEKKLAAFGIKAQKS